MMTKSMIEKFFHTWKGITALTAVALFLVVSFGSGNPLMALAQLPDPVLAPTMCILPDGTTGKLIHLDKIIFAPVKWFVHADSVNNPNMSPRFTYDIKVTDNPNAMKYANEEVASFLTTLGYKRTGGGPITALQIIVFDIDYAILCQ